MTNSYSKNIGKAIIPLIMMLGMFVSGVTGCMLGELPAPDDTPVNIRIPVIPMTPDGSDNLPSGYGIVLPDGWFDARDIMDGFCYDAMFDARDQIFIIRSAEEHIRFYDGADASELCRRAVVRKPFDFSGGAILIGGWSYGSGCTARHQIDGITRDDTNNRLVIDVRFETAGECYYELIRPIWLGIDNARDEQIQMNIR